MIQHPEYNNCKTHDLLYSRKDSDVVLRLAIAMIVDRAECAVDMVVDCAEEYPTKKDIEAVFATLPEDALYMVDEVMDGLKSAITARLKELAVSARVSQLNYDNAGKLEDITVAISTK